MSGIDIIKCYIVNYSNIEVIKSFLLLMANKFFNSENEDFNKNKISLS